MIAKTAYEAFFDELGLIERRAVLHKVASGELEKEAALGSSIARGAKNILTNAPSKTVGRLQRAWQGGVKAQAKRVGGLKPVQGPVQPGGASLGTGVDPSGLSGWQRFTGGLRGVARTGTGKALGATALGLGGAGVVGYGAGRVASS